jgi:hypothetical protein
MGVPSSRSAKDYARRIQVSDALLTEANLTLKVVGWRRLYFRKWLS